MITYHLNRMGSYIIQLNYSIYITKPVENKEATFTETGRDLH